MRKTYIVLIILIFIFVIMAYSTYALTLSKMRWKFVGLDTSRLDTSSVESLAESVGFMVELYNDAFFNVKVTDVKVGIFNENGLEVITVDSIDNIFVPKGGSTQVDLTGDIRDTGQLVNDILSQNIDKYTYKVTGKLGGIFPFRFTDSVTNPVLA